MLEAEVDKIEEHKRTLETQLNAIQNAYIQNETLAAMKQGAEAMKAIHKGMNIDKVDKTMDEIRDQMDISNEISEALSSTRLGAAAEDEDELQAELERMQQQELDEKLLGGERAPVTSKVAAPRIAQPATKHAAAEEEDEEEELRKLQAEFAM